MGGICHKKYYERGLFFEIKCQENLIASPTASEKEKAFAKKLLRSFKEYSEGDYGKTSQSTLVVNQREIASE